MNEGRNSLLERVQPLQAYIHGSYPMDNIISVIIIILKQLLKKPSYLCYNKSTHMCYHFSHTHRWPEMGTT